MYLEEPANCTDNRKDNLNPQKRKNFQNVVLGVLPEAIKTDITSTHIKLYYFLCFLSAHDATWMRRNYVSQ